MTDSPTVLVVGGGATGAGIARDLALRGVDVTLLDRGGFAGGTSGRSHGLLHSGARYAESDMIGAEECIEENQVLREIGGACIRDTGGLFVELDADDPQYFETKLNACEDAGIDTEQIDPAVVRDRVPGLSEDVVRAFAVPDAVIYPSRLVAANAADAENHGATVYPDAPLVDLTVDNGQIEQATIGGTIDDTIEPAFVINAAGAWAGQVASMAGLTVSMAPSRGVMVAVEYDDIDPVLNRCRPPDDGDIIVPHEHEVVLGTTSVSVDDPDEYERADWEIDRAVEACSAMVPAVETAPQVRVWWGVRPLYAPDEEGTNRRGISRGFTLVDHATEGVDNVASIVGGKITTYRQMAKATTDLVCERLGVKADCTTAVTPLPYVDDPETLDEYVIRYGGANPTDETIVSGTNKT